MILCVTLNPCLDKTLGVPAWEVGQSVRGISVREVVGGKGNNVARALRKLGYTDIRPVTFLGGAVGQRCDQLLREVDRVDPIVIPTESATREILTVRTEVTNEQTAFFDPDPRISQEEAASLLRSVESVLDAGRVQAMTLSGSSPSPSTHGLFSDLIALARGRRIPTFLDTYGPSLEGIWGFWPDVIQLNLREAGLYLKLPKGRPSESDIIVLLDRWGRRGGRVGVVTDGANRFVARVGQDTFRVAPPAIEPVNPIGSGDSFLAGVVDATLSGLSPEALLRHAVGCAVANAMVWDAGGFERADAEDFARQVVVEMLTS